MGKSRLAMAIAFRCQRGILFDREGEFHQLSRARPDMIYLPYRQLRFSIFDVRALPRDQREMMLLAAAADISGKAGLHDGSHNTLVDSIITLYRQGVARFGDQFVLTLGMVIQHLRARTHERLSFTERQYIDRVLSRLTLLERELGPAINAPHNMMPFLMERLVCLDLSGLSDRAACHLVNLIQVYKEFHVPVGFDEKPFLNSISIFDEAHVLASRDQQFAGENPFALAFIASRKRCISNVYITQAPSMVHQLVRGNCRTKIYFCLPEISEAELAARDLWAGDMNARHLQALQFLPPRWALIKHPECRYPLPMKVRGVNTTENIDKLALAERSLQALVSAGYSERIHSPVSAHELTPQRQDRPTTAPAELSPDTMMFLRAAAADPFLLVIELMDVLKMHGKRWDNVRRELEAKASLVDFRILHTGLRSPPPTWARPTVACYSALGITPVPSIANPDVQHDHQFWIERVCRKARSMGVFSEILKDKVVNNAKRVDVSARHAAGTRVGWEIELQDAQPHLLSNVLRDLTDCGLAHVTVLVTSRSQLISARNTLHTHLPSELVDRFTVEPAGNYL